MERKLIVVYVALDLVLIITSLVIGKNWFLNSQISFFISLFIAYSSLRAYKSCIQSEIHSGKYDDIDVELDDEKVKKIGARANFITFLSPLKIIGYTMLGASFYILNYFGFLNIFAFIAGVLPLPLGAIIFGMFFAQP